MRILDPRISALAAALILSCAASLPVAAQGDELKIPPEVALLVEKGTKAIALEREDLNGDNLEDFILVLEKANPARDENDFPTGQRPFLILVRSADGKLTFAKRNERIILCSECGGSAFPDPFEVVTVAKNTFTVEHYGGSAWRWKTVQKFNYSRIDKTWQPVRAEELSYHTSNPNKVKTKIYVPPKDFGKIDIADFDPENYLKRKPKK